MKMSTKRVSCVVFAVFIVMFFCFADFSEVFARGGGGSSSSSSGGGSRGGSSSSSSSRSGGGTSSSWGSSKSSVPAATPAPPKPSTTAPAPSGQTSSSWGSKSDSGMATKTTAPAPAAMKDTASGVKTSWGSKTESGPVVNASTARASAYANKNLVADKARAASVQNTVKNSTTADWGAARTNYSLGKQSYTPTRTPPRRSGEENRVIVNKYYNTYSSGGMMYGYADPFNHSMMFMFSTMWWMNMWDHVDRSHYRDDPRMRDLEKEVAVLKAQQGPNWKPDPNYKDPGMTDTVMYSDGYLQAIKEGKISPKELDKLAKESKGEEGLNWFTFFGVGFFIVVLALAGFMVVRMIRRNNRRPSYY